jgi:hypothetical protein
MKVLRLFIGTVTWIAVFLCALWATGALYFDFPIASTAAAMLFVVIVLAAILFVRRKLLKLAITLGVCALVASWWFTLKPANDREWQPDVARTAWAQIDGDEITIHNVRNCEYRAESDFTPRWETRTVWLSDRELSIFRCASALLFH